MPEPEKILAIAPAWVGDLIMAQALFKVLTQAADVELDVVGPGWAAALLNRMPEVAAAHSLAAGHGEAALVERYRLGRRLSHAGYGRAFILPRSFKSALVPWVAGIPRRTGFSSELRSVLLSDPRPLDRERLRRTVDRYASLGFPQGADLPELPHPALRIDTANQQRLRQRLKLSTNLPVVALMPGAAFGPAKMWPVEHFAELARQLTSRERAVWVLGSEADRSCGEQIIAGAGATARNLCGRTRLEDTVDLLALSAAAVSNDSGLMHIAAAAGTCVIGLFGSTPPEMTPPLTLHHYVHYLNLECSPCRQRTCPLGHLNCLRHISPDAVRISVDRALVDATA